MGDWVDFSIGFACGLTVGLLALALLFAGWTAMFPENLAWQALQRIAGW